MGKYFFFFKKGSLEGWFSGTKACTAEGHPWGHVKSPLFCDTSIPRARWEVEPETSPRGSRTASLVYTVQWQKGCLTRGQARPTPSPCTLPSPL